MRKVLFTASTHSHLVNFHLPYLRRFHDLGWTVHAACGGAAMPIPCADRVVALPFAKSMTAPENFSCARILGRLMRTEGYDLVVTNTSLAAFFTRLPLGKQRPVVVNIVHGYLFDENTHALKRSVLLAAERLTARRTDLVLTMNDCDLELAQRHRLGAKIAPIPGMGVSFERIDASPSSVGAALRSTLNLHSDAFLMVYGAEFSTRKNQEMLIRTLPRLPENAVLLLPGDGAELSRCRDLAGQLGLGGRVRFPGQVADMASCLRAADCAVSSSRSEGLPFHIMEAMRASLPVLASDVKGHRDLLGGGIGVLYPFDDEDAFVKAAALLMEDTDYRFKLGRAAFAATEPYSLAQVLPQVFRALETVIPIETVEARV